MEMKRTLCEGLPRLGLELPEQRQEAGASLEKGRLLIFLGLFALCLLTVFRVVPYPITTVVIAGALLFLDKKLLGKVDYMLLLTFVCFFVFVASVKAYAPISARLEGLMAGSPLLTSLLASQVISNVPACLLLSPFTQDAASLMLGVNLGGLGTLVASLASLISYKLYAASETAQKGRFFRVFTLLNVAMLAGLIALAWALGAV